MVIFINVEFDIDEIETSWPISIRSKMWLTQIRIKKFGQKKNGIKKKETKI